LLHLVGYLYYWQMGFNSVFKGLIAQYFGVLVGNRVWCCLLLGVVARTFLEVLQLFVMCLGSEKIWPRHCPVSVLFPNACYTERS